MFETIVSFGRSRLELWTRFTAEEVVLETQPGVTRRDKQPPDEGPSFLADRLLTLKFGRLFGRKLGC